MPTNAYATPVTIRRAPPTAIAGVMTGGRGSSPEPMIAEPLFWFKIQLSVGFGARELVEEDDILLAVVAIEEIVEEVCVDGDVTLCNFELLCELAGDSVIGAPLLLEAEFLETLDEDETVGEAVTEGLLF